MEYQGQSQQNLEPVEQESILFHGQTIVAVRLADGRICVVLRWICESLKLQPGGQVRRIERTATTASELVRVKVQTPGGKQTMPAITLKGFPVWILTISPGEIQDEQLRELIIAYQTEAKDVLYEHFINKSRQPALPESQVVIPAEPVKPAQPRPDAAHDIWIEYHEQMARWHQWQRELENWRGTVDTKIQQMETEIGSLREEVRSILPQFGLSTEHKETTRNKVLRISKLEGLDNPGSIWNELNTAFGVSTYKNIPDEKWEQVSKWLQRREKAAQRRKDLREQQTSLFDESTESEDQP